MKVLPGSVGDAAKTGATGLGGARTLQTAEQTPSDPFSTIAATNVQAALEELLAEASSGAPTTADYLVGTTQAGLSAEIVVGTSPGGELGGTWASPTVDATHSGSAHTDFIAKAFLDAKGDLITATADNTPARLAAGTDGYKLMARAGATNGIEWVADYRLIEIFLDGGGSTLTTGLRLVTSPLPYSGVIIANYVDIDADGAIVIDVGKGTTWAGTHFSSICSSAKPTITATGGTDVTSTDSTLSGWTTSFSIGDRFSINIDSVTAAKWAMLGLKVRLTS